MIAVPACVPFDETVVHADGAVLTLRTRAGKSARVDDSDAVRTKQVGVLVPGNAYMVEGTTYDSTSALRVGRRPGKGFAGDLAAGSLTIKALFGRRPDHKAWREA